MNANSEARPRITPRTPRMAKSTLLPMYRSSLTMSHLRRAAATRDLQTQSLPVHQTQTGQQEYAMHPPQTQHWRRLAFFQRVACRNQDGEVSHVQQDRRQQLEEAPLTWIDPRQRQRQTPLQLGRVTQRWLTVEQLTGGDGIAVGDLVADVGLWQQCPIGVVLDDAVVGLPGIAVIAIAVFQNQVTTAVWTDFLTPLLPDQDGDAVVLLLAELLLGNERAAEIDPVIGQGFGVGHATAIAQRLETTGHQGVELGHCILLVEQQLELGSALRCKTEAQPGDQQGNQGSGRHGHPQQALLAHAGGRQDGHFAFQVQPPVSQENPEKQTQRQNQLQKTGQTKAHDQKQHARVERTGCSLGQVFDETATHDDYQQHGAD